MTRRMLLYEIAKVLLLFLELVCIAAIGYGTISLIWYTIQYFMPLTYEQLITISNSVPDKVSFAGKYLRLLAVDITKADALARIIRGGLAVGIGIPLLMLFRLLLRTVERRFKDRCMPDVLRETFTDLSYEAKRRSAYEETLCDVGLLSRVERYYTANRLEGLYRDCWVASQEIICGGVYADHYTSHTVKVRGQWLTIRLNCDFEGTLILECRKSKNRFSHRVLARKMVELEVDHQALAANFACYTDSPDDARNLLTVEMADKLVAMLDCYPDICAIFRHGCIHILIRRRSFNRRWEALCPFCYPQLRREAHRLYDPLLDFTDKLLE